MKAKPWIINRASVNVGFDVFKHQPGTRVIEESTGQHGVVVSVCETAAEWIEPIIKFDGEDQPRRAKSPGKSVV